MSLRRRLGRLYGSIRGGETTLAMTARFRAAISGRGAASMFSGTPCSRLEGEEGCSSGQDADVAGAGRHSLRRPQRL